MNSRRSAGVYGVMGLNYDLRKVRKTSRIIFGLVRDCRVQSNHGQHPAGFSFFGAVGVVATQITGRARAGVVDVLNA